MFWSGTGRTEEQVAERREQMSQEEFEEALTEILDKEAVNGTIDNH